MANLAARVVKLEQRIKPGDALDQWISSLTNDELRLAILDAAREVAGRDDVAPQEAEKARTEALAIEQELFASAAKRETAAYQAHIQECARAWEAGKGKEPVRQGAYVPAIFSDNEYQDWSRPNLMARRLAIYDRLGLELPRPKRLLS